MPETEEKEEIDARKKDAVKAAPQPGGGDAAAVAAERAKNMARAEADVDLDDDIEPGDAAGAMRAVADAEPRGNLKDQISSQEAMDATDWFLDPDPEEDVSTRTFRLRVGKPGSKREWIKWVVQALPRERITQIRDENRKPVTTRDARRGLLGEIDIEESNLRIATEGTLVPDLQEMRSRSNVVDPADALRLRFDFKPGLIDQICGEVIAASGFDDSDVDEIKAGKTS